MKEELDDIRMYMDLLRESEAQRLRSNYFFVTINVVLLLAVSFLPEVVPGSIYASVLFSTIGVFLTTYWVFEQRETHILHEVRFRTMLDLERRYYGKGALDEEWERLGDYPFRRSPVFFVSLSRALPLVFMMAHVAMFVLTVLLGWGIAA